MKKCLKCKAIFIGFDYCPTCHSIWIREITHREKFKYITNIKLLRNNDFFIPVNFDFKVKGDKINIRLVNNGY